MKPALFAPRTFFIAAVTCIVILTVLGWGLWSLSASQYRDLIDSRIAEGRAAGYDIGYGERQLFGFPRRITMRFKNLHWKTADGIEFHVNDMDVVATPWNWNDYEAKFKNHASLALPLDTQGHALLLSSESGHAWVTLDNDGVWQKARLSLDDSKAGLAPSYLFSAEKLSASVARPDLPPKDHTQVGLNLEGEADKMLLPDAMPSPFGSRADKFAVRMRVMGQVPDVRRRASVEAWNKGSGIVEFDQFALDWGVLKLQAKGTVGFDDDLQPEGAFSGHVGDPEQTMRTLIANGFIGTHDQDILDAIMETFARPQSLTGQGMDMPITVQLGGLFFGPIRIFTFPEIEWPVEPPPAN